ncbi:MAG: ribonuclease HII [Candidatus Zipacnadales bacterium]
MRPEQSPWSDESNLWRLDLRCVEEGYTWVAGVDEAGRGALAGPVVAAAVVMPPGEDLAGIGDSKTIDAVQRKMLYRRIRASAVGVGIGIVDERGVDEMNVLRATYRAMATALARCRPEPDLALIDGPTVRGITIPYKCLVGGDRRTYVIAAASIVAKVTRDALMEDLDALYPGYGFAEHKGYGTAAHRAAILARGPCFLHRRSFGPLAQFHRPRLPGFD